MFRARKLNSCLPFSIPPFLKAFFIRTAACEIFPSNEKVAKYLRDEGIVLMLKKYLNYSFLHWTDSGEGKRQKY